MASSLQVAAACFLLLTCCIFMAAAKPDSPTPSSVHDHSKKHLLQGGGKDAAAGVVGKLKIKGMEQQDESCDGEDECLKRRTLVAHTDYIYTQGKHN